MVFAQPQETPAQDIPKRISILPGMNSIPKGGKEEDMQLLSKAYENISDYLEKSSCIGTFDRVV
jgi:hypothetical protein